MSFERRRLIVYLILSKIAYTGKITLGFRNINVLERCVGLHVTCFS